MAVWIFVFERSFQENFKDNIFHYCFYAKTTNARKLFLKIPIFIQINRRIGNHSFRIRHNIWKLQQFSSAKCFSLLCLHTPMPNLKSPRYAIITKRILKSLSIGVYGECLSSPFTWLAYSSIPWSSATFHLCNYNKESTNWNDSRIAQIYVGNCTMSEFVAVRTPSATPKVSWFPSLNIRCQKNFFSKLLYISFTILHYFWRTPFTFNGMLLDWPGGFPPIRDKATMWLADIERHLAIHIKVTTQAYMLAKVYKHTHIYAHHIQLKSSELRR